MQKQKLLHFVLHFIFKSFVIHCFHVGITEPKVVHIVNRKLSSVQSKNLEKQQHRIYILSQEEILPW